MFDVFDKKSTKSIKQNREEINRILLYFPKDLGLEPLITKIENSKNIFLTKSKEKFDDDLTRIISNLNKIRNKYSLDQNLSSPTSSIKIEKIKNDKLRQENEKLSLNVKILERTNEDLQQKLLEKQDIILKIEERERKILEDFLKKENNEVQELNGRLSIHYENKINDLKLENQNCEELIEKIREKESENFLLKQKIEKFQGKYLKKKEKIEELEQKYNLKKANYQENIEILTAKLEKFKSKNAVLKNENSKLTKRTDLDKKTTSLKPIEFLPYDIVINIDSLTKKPGWEVEINNQKLINEELSVSIVGLVGRENIGKTFILNKICEDELPSGANVNTKGLSLKYSKEKNLICLDSAGMMTPVYYYEDKILNSYSILKENFEENPEIKLQMINNRAITDAFIQDFILEVCEVIVIVLGHLSQNDQKLIERIERKYRAKKKIIIIHNFSDLFTVEDVEKKIENDIFKAFNVIEKQIPGSNLSEYIEKSLNEKQENISHLILAAEGHESGDKYNEISLKYIGKILDTCNDYRNFNIIKELTDFVQENYRLYFNFKKKPEKGVSLKYYDNERLLKIETEEKYEISNPIFNSLGTLITNPPYEVYERIDKYICVIEIPDLERNSLKYKINKTNSEFNVLIIKGIKKYNEFSEEKNERIYGNRNCGDFLIMIPLGFNYIQVKVNKFLYKSGILTAFVDIINEPSAII